jgi:hypothetical protein
MRGSTNWSTSCCWGCARLVTRCETRFAGYDCIGLENEALTLWLTRMVGPRVIGLALPGGENLFAELPGETLECPGTGRFSFRGGHRLWYAPEEPRRTYLPDDRPVSIAEIENGLRVTQPVEAPSGIQKSLTVTLPDRGADRAPCVVVDHTLHNRGRSPVELAPWAITQLKPGGVAILPQARTPVDQYGLLPNRHIVLWPYTRLNSPHITWGDHHVLVKATMQDGALKLGFPNPEGWLAYAVAGSLFVKYAVYQPDADYFDRGSSSECYCNPRFLELETLGPRTKLAPGSSVSHRETWTVHASASIDDVRELVGADHA